MSPLRRYLYLLLLVILVPSVVQVAVWVAQALEERRAAPPVKAVRAFVDALGRGDCQHAMALLSAPDRSVVEAQMRAKDRRQGASAPRGCWTPALRVFHGLRAKSARLASQTEDTAVVSLDHYEADPKSFLFPGFWPTRYIVTPREVRLVAESGTWMVVVP